jgi:hypothetical protein
MRYNFFKILADSNELKKNKKFLQKENPEGFKVLFDFLVTIEENFHYSEKHEYIKLAKYFLADQITADDFWYSFMAIYEGINQKLGQMERDEFLDLTQFLTCPLNQPFPPPKLPVAFNSTSSFSVT